MQQDTKSIIRQGLHDGIPIAMGYYAVAFSLGIIARQADLNIFTGFVCSFLTRASAGEYGVYSLMAAGASYAEIVGISLIANLRYLLMSASITQKFADGTSLLKRVLVAFFMTDEIFGISIAYPGKLPPAYTVSAALFSTTFWALGTASGIMAGDALPANVVAALGVALYGMFLAIVIPPAKKDHNVGMAVIASFLLSGLCAVLPYVRDLSSGIRTILLTIVISAVVAWLKPVKPSEE